MSSYVDKIFEEKWEIIVQFGFSRILSDDGRPDTTYHDQYPADSMAVEAAISNLCDVNTAEPLYLVKKLLANCRELIEGYILTKLRPKIEESHQQGFLLPELILQWKSQVSFAEWLCMVFYWLNSKLCTDTYPEAASYGLEAQYLSKICFADVTIDPFLPIIGAELLQKFDSCVSGAALPEDVGNCSALLDMLMWYSTPKSDFLEKLRVIIVLHRKRYYHRMATQWLKSLPFEEFASRITFYSWREKDVAECIFDRRIWKVLYDETKRIYFGIYLPRAFQQNKEQYATWIKERNSNALRQVNPAIGRNRDLARKATEILRVSLLEEICSTLKHGCAPFLRNGHKSGNPFHIQCPSSRKPDADCPVRLSDRNCEETFVSNMLFCFARYEALLQSFSYSKLRIRSRRAVQNYIFTECPNCILPTRIASFCGSLLWNYKHCEKFFSADYFSFVCKFVKTVLRPASFRRAFCEDLYKRLMQNKLATKDLELLVISKLSGFQAFGQAEGMLRDHDKSQKFFHLFMNSALYTALREKNDMRMVLRINMFRRGTLSHRPNSQIAIPREIRVCHLGYEDFFRARQGGATIQWNFALGTVTVHTTMFGKGGTPLTEFELNLEQFSVLNLFQDKNTQTVREMLESLILSTPRSSKWEHTAAILKDVILSMATSRCPLLKKVPGTSEVGDSDIILLNTAFASDKPTFKVPKPNYAQSYQLSVSSGDSATMKRYRIEASIIRTMKAMRRASRENIFALVEKQCAKFVPVDTEIFDNAIQRLIEREYITKECGIGGLIAYLP